MRAAVIAVALVGCGRIGFDSETGGLSEYRHRKSIEVGPWIDHEIADVVVHLTLSDPEIAAGAAADGSDLVVTEGDGVTLLDRELVSYTAGKVDLWVRLPAHGGIRPTSLYLYYGGASVDAPLPWGAHVRGVWHMNQRAGVVPETVAAHDAAQVDPTKRPVEAAGIAGVAQEYDGVDDTLTVNDPADGSLDFGTDSFAYSLWVFVSQTVGPFDLPLHKGGSDATTAGYDLELGATDWEALISDGTITRGSRFGDVSAFLGRWVQLVAVVDRRAGELRVYADGVPGDVTDITGVGSVDTAMPLQLGRDTDFFRGMIDEVRIYTGDVDLDHVAVEHASLTRPELVVVGPEETR